VHVQTYNAAFGGALEQVKAEASRT